MQSVRASRAIFSNPFRNLHCKTREWSTMDEQLANFSNKATSNSLGPLPRPNNDGVMAEKETLPQLATAFGRPPPLPPLLGPVFLISILEMIFDKKDND